MSEALIPGETLDWPMFSRFKFEVGDLVFIYASSPVLQMIGKLEIEEIGLDFREADPRNDLRKWPKIHSRAPWMRLRVLQTAPIPFRPLQRGSLYYHTEFKPSPYPKLLHDNEREYVLRAFDEAMNYSAGMRKYENGINPEAVGRVKGGDMLCEVARRLIGGRLSCMRYSSEENSICLTFNYPDSKTETVAFNFSGIVRARWEYTKSDDIISAVRLTLEDTYLLANIDGADIEILAMELSIG